MPDQRGRFLAQKRERTHGKPRFAAGGAVALTGLSTAGAWAATGPARGPASPPRPSVPPVSWTPRPSASAATPARSWTPPTPTTPTSAPSKSTSPYHALRGFNLFPEPVELHPRAQRALRVAVGSRGRYGAVRTSDVRVAVPAGSSSSAPEAGNSQPGRRLASALAPAAVPRLGRAHGTRWTLPPARPTRCARASGTELLGDAPAGA